MIRPDKYENALWALNAVLVWIRKMTYEKAGYKLLGDVLEVAEMLPHVSSPTRRHDRFLPRVSSKTRHEGFELQRGDREI